MAPLEDNLVLFDDLPLREEVRLFNRLQQPVWTENKAKFICRYLSLFVLVTRHGTYIDGFAGPQWRDKPEAWAAKLVLASEPHWFRHFHLCELNRKSFSVLKSMVECQPKIDSRGNPIKREVAVSRGDFNKNVDLILAANQNAKEATFCLLDQRTFECHWETVRKLAAHKPPGANKIELFYFLAVGWIHRSLSGVKGDKAAKWWGRNDWAELRPLSHDAIVNLIIERFEKELGYKWVRAFPIYAHEKGHQVLYHMIHASDHDEAPDLMVRAYNTVLKRSVKGLQREMDYSIAPTLDIV
jgi:three-Cys-motif partner protein